MKKLILTAALLLGTSHIANAAQLPILDMDALLFSSESVVEGPIVGENTVDYVNANSKFTWKILNSADVKVEKTLLGVDLNGKTVNVGNLSIYKKWTDVRFVEGERLPIIDKSWFPTANLETGDRAIFFLKKPPVELKTTAQFWTMMSGVRLLRKTSISGFSQASSVGGYTESDADLRSNFDGNFAASLARVDELKSQLSAPSEVENRAFFVEWKARRKEYAKRAEWVGGDAIDEAVKKKLALIDAQKEAENGKGDG